MKKIVLILTVFIFMGCYSYSQTEEVNNAIKLFLNEEIVYNANTNARMESYHLTQVQLDRLYRKVTTIINQTGIVETGYSSFLVVPRFDVLSFSESDAGMAKVVMAECELGISVKRASNSTYEGAVFNSYTKRLIGSGSTQADAINNALNNLSGKDNDMVGFFSKTKEKIDAYFKANCKSVVKEADQALQLKQYGKAIALYFSVPSTAPCYTEAFASAQKVYGTYIEDECNKKLVMLKAYVALAQNENQGKKNYYDSSMNIMRSLSPASDKCYAEAKLQIAKIEQRLDEAQKREWELIRKLSTEDADVQKERYKAMGRINATYQPATNVIIAH